MSLIVINKKTLGKSALIAIRQAKGKTTSKKRGKITIIRDETNKIVSINLENYNKYFKGEEGIHTLNFEQKKWFERNNIQIPNQTWFSIGEIIERTEHPKSKKLFILKIKTDKILQIITNLKDALVGKKIVVANVGAILPNGLNIEKFNVLGVESEGMICAGKTLGKEAIEGILFVEGNPGNEFIL